MTDEKKPQEYVYRCRLCGELKAGAIGSFTHGDAIQTIITVEEKGSVCKPGAVIGKINFHNCRDGSLGIADLIGVRKHLS